MRKRFLAVVVAAAMAFPAAAAEVRVMISSGFHGVYSQVIPEFEKRTGHHLVTVRGPSIGDSPEAIPTRLARGEMADVVIIDGAAVDELAQRGMVKAETKVILARSLVGMVVRAGQPKPDISTVEAFKRTVLAAKSIAYSDSGSGTYLSKTLFPKLGIADEIAPRSRKVRGPPSGEPVAAVVARGEAEIGFQQVSELLPVEGVTFVDALPAELQPGFTFAGALTAKAKEPEAGAELIRYLGSPEVAPTITRTGLQPIAKNAQPTLPAAAPRADSEAALPIPVKLLKPEGAGPFPAVVMLHDCSGLGPRSSGSPARWAEKLVKRGYVVAIPDSFSTRGHAGGVCTDPSPSRVEVNPFRRVEDAYVALDYLRSQPFVLGDRIGVMGGSHGGTTTLASVALLPRDPMAERKRHGFAAAVALYPGCAVGRPSFTTRYEPAAPLLILAGELDDWTPAAPCEALAANAVAHGGDVAIKVYGGAHHSFDSASPRRFVATRMNGNAPGGRGATTGGDPDAWADSVRQVESFFARHLGA